MQDLKKLVNTIRRRFGDSEVKKSEMKQRTLLMYLRETNSEVESKFLAAKFNIPQNSVNGYLCQLETKGLTTRRKIGYRVLWSAAPLEIKPRDLLCSAWRKGLKDKLEAAFLDRIKKGE